MTQQIIPREVLFGNPEKSSPQISPDGKRLAYLAPVDDVLNVWVGTVGGEDFKPVTTDTDRGIRNYLWAENNTHIIYMQDIGGNENFRLYTVNPDNPGAGTRELTPFDNVQVRIVEHSKDHPDELLIAMNKDNEQLHDVYHLELNTGDLNKIAENPGNIIGWAVDSDFKVRGAMAARPDGGFDLLIRDDEPSDWQTLIGWDDEDSMTSGLVSFTKDGKGIHIRDSRGVNAGRLLKMDLATQKTDVLAEDPGYDVSDVMIHPDTYEIQAVSFTRAREQWEVLDDSIREDFAVIEKLARGDFGVTCRDHADQTWLVAFSPDNGPVSYYSYDRLAKQGTFLFHHKPDLNDYQLAEMEPFSFQTSDGLTVHGYVTFPVGVEKKNLPLVLDVHGGPWDRDHWGFTPDSQWFANRGYICMQVNFRGSTGYGKQFLNAGNKQWSLKMHDDLVEAVQWAVDKGYADPDKLAIFGGSYGGYAALVGATFTPDLFCCAVDIVGPSNLLTLIESIPPYWAPLLSQFTKRVGDPETEEQFLKDCSPLFKVDQIKIPILIGQGANDPRVKQAESEQIVEAMKSKGIDYEYMLFEDEGHGFAKPENRLKFFAAAEKFLAKHLGGRFEKQ